MSVIQENSAKAKTLDGEPLSIHIDPESEHPFSVSLSSFGYDSITWACTEEQHAWALFDALQYAKLVDMD